VRYYRQALELWPAEDDERAYVLLELAESRALSAKGGNDEATEARDALLSGGDMEAAARAEALLSNIAFNEGRGATAMEHAERALDLARDLAPSRSKARVLENASIVHLFGGSAERALAEAHDLRQVVEEIGADKELGFALWCSGTARIELGDLDGVEEAESALALERELRSPFATEMASHIAVTLFDLGRLSRGFELIAEAHENATRLGSPWMEQLDVLHMHEHYWKGNWDDAVRLADETLGNMGPVRARIVRSQIRLARGRVQEAADDARDALEIGRAAGHLKSLHSALAVHARTSLTAGSRPVALAAVDELLERFVAEGPQGLSGTMPDFAIAAVELGQADAFRQAIARIKKPAPWIDAARAFAAGDFCAAATAYTQIGSRADAAYARLCAAKALIDSGRSVEADEPLQEALIFYRSVGATRCIREGEALLAASQPERPKATATEPRA
jgi:tetratricopeptide (TPR) repeat protein